VRPSRTVWTATSAAADGEALASGGPDGAADAEGAADDGAEAEGDDDAGATDASGPSVEVTVHVPDDVAADPQPASRSATSGRARGRRRVMGHLVGQVERARGFG
jgi:hypothetical protein